MIHDFILCCIIPTAVRVEVRFAEIVVIQGDVEEGLQLAYLISAAVDRKYIAIDCRGHEGEKCFGRVPMLTDLGSIVLFDSFTLILRNISSLSASMQRNLNTF